MAVVETTAGFKFEYRLCGQQPTRQPLVFKDSETLTKGDLVNIETGEVDLATTGDTTTLIGMANQTLVGVDSTTVIEVIVDDDAVYSVFDGNARAIGAQLDIAGATGAMTVATDANHNLIVVANSTADERTLVRINPAQHVLHR